MPDSPEEPVENHSHAHYYLFKEIFVQRRLVKVGGKWRFRGASIRLLEVFHIRRSRRCPSPSLEFNRALSQLMIDLQRCWTHGAPPNVAAMFQLQILGRTLIERGICPEFEWASEHLSQPMGAFRTSCGALSRPSLNRSIRYPICPLTHNLITGADEGRRPTRAFDGALGEIRTPEPQIRSLRVGGHPPKPLLYAEVHGFARARLT